MDGEETYFVSLTAETGNRTPNSGVKGSGATLGSPPSFIVDRFTFKISLQKSLLTCSIALEGEIPIFHNHMNAQASPLYIIYIPSS